MLARLLGTTNLLLCSIVPPPSRALINVSTSVRLEKTSS
jgi:hypothetical protein